MLDFVAMVQLVISLVAALVGFPALLSSILTALEYFQKIDEALSDKISFWANAGVFVGVFYMAVTGQLSLLNSIDEALGQFAKVLVQVLILIGVPTGFAITKNFQDKFRTAKFVGLK